MSREGNKAIMLTVTGVTLIGGDSGPGNGIRMITGSRMTGRDVVSFILEPSRDLLSKVFEFVRMKSGTKKIGEITIDVGEVKIRVADFSEDNVDKVFSEVRRTLAHLRE